MDGAELREARAPAPLGVYAAKMSLSAGSLGARSGAVRGLPESIAELLRADLDRLEQHVVLGISGHDCTCLIMSAGHRRRRAESFHDLCGKSCFGHGLDHRDR